MDAVINLESAGSPAASELAWTPELRQWLVDAAADAGFDLAGIATVDAAGSLTEQQDADRFTEWLDLGRAGEMDYLKRRNAAGDLLRNSVQLPMPWARSVILCAFNYNATFPRSTDEAPRDRGWIARYAWSGTPGTSPEIADGELVPVDYHDELLRRLHLLERDLQRQTGCQTRSYVDTGPMVERSLAARAGVGWIGKNTCVLHQQAGSWLLLGAVVTALRLPPALQPELAADRCGSCTRCLDACPTEALVAPRQMDASRCIAYLTIEKKGEIAEPLRSLMGRQVFGCDICQDVCPWNRQAPVSRDARVRPRPELVNPSLHWLAGLSPSEFRRVFRGSPLERTGRKRLLRNVAIAMGNSGDRQHTATLDQWRHDDDPVLAATALWALDKFDAESPRAGVEPAIQSEPPQKH